ncbi:hypothetical protein PVAND_015811 [Polypedilum vanderplanki]|uniref:Zinc finger protein n=1 Tax=Polypedilum vanderplanki TaxID=319348 RepID=A0A9J6BDQ3_POLVA|nr:hypothetical protein PVAND_015811 [Polypedilum vanderplanki]
MSNRSVELNLCRICNKISSNFVKHNSFYKKSIFDLISLVSDLEIITDNRIPSNICCNCTLELQKSKEFLSKVNSTNEKIVNNYVLHESCRLCLGEFFEKNPVHIYKTVEGVEDCRNYNELIAKISRANINRPELQYFCTNCYNSLNNFQIFKMKIIKSETKLMKQIGKSVVPKIHEIKLEHDPIEVKEESERKVVEFLTQDPLEQTEIEVKEEPKIVENSQDTQEDFSEIDQNISGTDKNLEAKNLPKKLKIFKCSHEDCNLEFFTKIERFHHMKIAGHLDKTSVTNRQFHCYCGLIFTSKREQLNHIRLTHNARFKCNSCACVVFNEKTCQSHIRKEHGSGFFTVGLLTKGINEKNGKDVFKCSICDLNFEDFMSYKIHVDGIEHYENGTHYYDGGNDEDRNELNEEEMESNIDRKYMKKQKNSHNYAKNKKLKGNEANLRNKQVIKSNNQQTNSNILQCDETMMEIDKISYKNDGQLKTVEKFQKLDKKQKYLQKVVRKSKISQAQSVDSEVTLNSSIHTELRSENKKNSKSQSINQNSDKFSKISYPRENNFDNSESHLDNFNKFINPTFTNSTTTSNSSNFNQLSTKLHKNPKISIKNEENSTVISSDPLTINQAENSLFFDPLKIEKPEVTIVEEFHQVNLLNVVTNDEKLTNFHPVVELERIKIDKNRINLKELQHKVPQINSIFDVDFIKIEDDRSQLVIMNEKIKTEDQNSTIVDQTVTCESCNKMMSSSFYHKYHINAPFHKFFLEFPQFRPEKTKRQQKLTERTQMKKMKFLCDVCQKGVIAAYYKIHLKSSSHKFYLSNPNAERKKRKPRSKNEDFSKDILVDEYDPKKTLALVCDYCRRKFFKKTLLENHIKTHCSSFYVVPCTFCNEKFLNHTTMNIHRKKNHASNDGNYSCEICNKTYEKHQEYLKHCASVGHLKILNGPKEKQSTCIKENYTCFICNQNFSCGDSYKRHCGTYHVDENEFCTRRYKTSVPFTDVDCKLCFQTFDKPNELQIHYVMDHDNSESFKLMGRGLLTCHCGKMLSRNVFKIHIEKFHPTSTVCETCGINFGENLRKFRYHRQYGHLPFISCDICGYKTQAKIRMRNHIERHLNIFHYRYVCETCGKCFGIQNHLDRHIQKNHQEGEKISIFYECDRCDKKYKCRKSLKEHKMYKHESAKRTFKIFCEICELKFEKMCKYKNHAKTAKHIEKANTLGVPIFNPKNI